ncbi:hypothetical protein TRICI_006337 [Trichomonascus ciferrii]|uniref:Uncharacterized protein n=1 Tax=Trichomonascus ciferrii TaxID=44093 RepID=A0A642UID2_9ASCO|nr:hypothetical protein TRICI_006337 [Trichomonascus ciferrii]
MFGHNQVTLPDPGKSIFLNFSNIDEKSWAQISKAFHSEIWKLIDMNPNDKGPLCSTFISCGVYLIQHSDTEVIQAIKGQVSFEFRAGGNIILFLFPPKDWTKRRLE